MVRLAGERIALRPFGFEDAPALIAIVETPEVAEWWGEPREGFPFTDYPDATRMTIILGATVVGLIQFEEESDADYRSASIDVFIDPELAGQGLGTDAVRTLARHLTSELGHHRITIDPAVDNARAIRSYEKVGFKPVGVLRSAQREPSGTWRDVLLMDILASELA